MTKHANIESLTMPVWPDTGRALGLSRGSTYEAIARGEIPVIRIGKRLLVPKKALAQMLEGGRAA
jgi:excisionase family DNA binding protein